MQSNQFRRGARVATVLAFSMTAALVAQSANAQDPVYAQPFLAGSSYGSALGVQDQMDSFTVQTNASIGQVTWAGEDFSGIFGVNPVNPTSFQVNFYSIGAKGQPGTLLSSTTIGNYGNAVDTGTLNDGLELYTYSGTLATPFQAAAGSNYLIQIVDPTDNKDWLWAAGSGPDGTHLTSFAGGKFSSSPGDLDFALYSPAAVPEPTTVALMLAGLGLIGVARRRDARVRG